MTMTAKEIYDRHFDRDENCINEAQIVIINSINGITEHLPFELSETGKFS